MLTVLARDGRHVQLQSRFEDFHKLLDAWLDVVPPDTAPPDPFRWLVLVDKFGGPLEININQIAHSAALSADSSTVVSLANELFQCAFTCYRRNQPRLMEDFLRTLVFLYYQCIDRDEITDNLGDRLNRGLHSLFVTTRSTRPGSGDQPPTEVTRLAALEVVLRFSLSLTHAAIRHEQSQHASNFVEQIFLHRKHREMHRSRGPVTMQPETLLDYVAVVLAGWALHVLQSRGSKDGKAAQSVLSAALKQVPSAPVLLAQWELLRGADWYDAAIDNRLGISNWDIRDWQRDLRPGVVEVRMGGPDWVRLGLRASLLHSNDRFVGEASQLFSGQPRRFIWDPTNERKALLSLAADPLINIPEAERQKRVESVMRFIEQRARVAHAEYLRYVLNTSLSSSRETQLREDALNAFSSKQYWQRAFRNAGLSSAPIRSCPRPIREGIRVPREYFLDESSGVSGLGDELGETVATRESMAVIHLVETQAARGGFLDSLITLPEKLREVRRAMIDVGFQPNIVILPREQRFANALFQRPLWQVEGRNEFGRASFGSWDQLSVLRFPYTNCQSVLLLDTRFLFGDHSLEHGTSIARVWIEDPTSEDEIESKKSVARDALDSAEMPIPESSSVEVVAWMEVFPRLGLVDTNAASAIDICTSAANFVVIDGSNIYHRPTCPDIRGETFTYVLCMDSDGGKTPCSTCRPDRWNLEVPSDSGIGE